MLEMYISRYLANHTLMTVQFEYAPGDHGFGLKSLLGIPLGTSLTGI